MTLYTTIDELGEVPPIRAWSAIRALRAAPPGLASRRDRRRVFTTALEQAEQLFRAAETVGPETKPLLLFYGLSQAGRAISAAQAAEHWVLSGHGIRIGQQRGHEHGLAGLTVSPAPSGAFGSVRDLLRSSNMAHETRIGDLWPLLFETHRHRLRASGDDRSLTVRADYTGWPSGIPTFRIGNIPAEFADVGQGNLDLATGLGADYSAQADALSDYLSRYPTLAERTPFTRVGQPVGLQLQGDGTCSVAFRVPDASLTRYPTAEAFESSVAVMARGTWRVYPSLDNSGMPVHPLLVWWAILFRLSMLSRYEPETWDRMTDVNRSPDAVPAEHLLDRAISSVPESPFNVLNHGIGAAQTLRAEESVEGTALP